MLKVAVCVFAALLFVSPRPGAAQSGWEPDISAFEAADRTDPPSTGAVLFAGSSSIRMWTSVEEDFKGTPVINRGFGGSTMADLIHYAHRIVVPYEPRLVVVYEGDNDVASGMSAEEVFDDYRRFVALVRNRLPQTRIAFISIKPSPAGGTWPGKCSRRTASSKIMLATARIWISSTCSSPCWEATENRCRISSWTMSCT